MRKAFTLIELMICIAIVAIICAIAIPQLMAKRNETPVSTKVDVSIGTSTYQAQKFEIEGHNYFLINHSNWHGFTAVHNPECPKCKPVKDIKVEQ
jgi:prepilin-type N-terminal cleavage/methylation domain-containing protein